MTISNNFDTLQRGLNIYTAGVALQEFFILCFLFLVFTFQRRLSREETDSVRLQGAKKLLIILYVSLTLISVCQSIPSLSSHPLSPLLFLPSHPIINKTRLIPNLPVSNPLPHNRIQRWCRNSTNQPIPAPRILAIRIRRCAHVLRAFIGEHPSPRPSSFWE